MKKVNCKIEDLCRAGDVQYGAPFRRPKGQAVYIRICFRQCSGINENGHVYGADLENGNVYSWKLEDPIVKMNCIWSAEND